MSGSSKVIHDSDAPARKRDREVLDVAADIFREKGYTATTVQDIADALGILKGSLYHYIESKEDLLFRLLEEAHQDVEAILHQVESEEDMAPLDRLGLYVRLQVEYSMNNLNRVSVYYHDIDRLGEKRREVIIARRHEHEVFVKDLIVEAQKAGQAKTTDDPAILANCVFATVIWAYRWYKPGATQDPAELSAICARFAVEGIRSGAPVSL